MLSSRGNRFLLFLWLFFIAFFIKILISEEVSLLIGLKESGDMKGSFSFDKEGYLIQKGDEGVDGNLRLFFSEVGDQELFSSFLDE